MLFRLPSVMVGLILQFGNWMKNAVNKLSAPEKTKASGVKSTRTTSKN